MSISIIWKKLSIATASAVFIVGTVNAAPASAIMFSFQGNLDTGGTPFNGSVTVDDDIFGYIIKIFKTPNMLTPTIFDPNGIFSLKVGDTMVNDGGLFLSIFQAYNGGRPAGLGNSFEFLNIRTSSRYSLLIAPFECSQELACFGALNDALSPEYYDKIVAYEFPVTASNSKSVSEPTAAIALGVIGASMLIRKRKLSSSPQA